MKKITSGFDMKSWDGTSETSTDKSGKGFDEWSTGYKGQDDYKTIPLVRDTERQRRNSRR